MQLSVFLRDAVHVIPLDPQATSTASTFSRPHSRAALASATAAVGKIKSSPAVQAIGLTPATRRGALLRALRTNPVILRADPAAKFFVAWVDTGHDAARCITPTPHTRATPAYTPA